MNRPFLRDNWRTALLAVAALAVGLVVGVVAAGGDDDGDGQPVASAATQTVTQTKTRTVRGGRDRSSGGRTRTVVRTRTVTVPEEGGAGGGGGRTRVPSGGRTITGKDYKNLGDLSVPRKSTLTWSNKGDVFAILTETNIIVSSIKKSGKQDLPRGLYKNFRVTARGNWRLTIEPQ